MQTIPLSKLTISEKYNVRKTDGDKGLEELVASIKAHGLLENLVVINGDNDNYEVIAGGRRLRALKILEDKHELPNSCDIPCEVVAAGSAEEISLAENMVRTPMHPADQFEAWVKLIETGMSAADIAARFGVSDTLVLQRLKLGRVSPKLMQAYRDEKINLEALMAFTLADDHEKQEELFERIKDNSWTLSNPNSIRNALTEESVRNNSRIAKFVGVDAYVEAGGIIRKDLFEEDVYFDNPTLLEELAANKLQQKADEVKGKWKWSEPLFELDYEERGKYKSIHPHLINEVPEELLSKQEELESQIDAVDYSSNEDYEKVRALRSELGALEEQLESYKGFSDEEHAIGGCIVSIGHNGDFQITEGLVKPEDAKSLQGSSENSNSGSKAKAEPQRYSNALVDRLKNYRLHSVKMAMANDYETAFDAALYMMCCKSFKQYYNNSWLKVQCEEYHYPYSLLKEDETCIEIEAREKKLYNKLPLSWMNIKNPVEQFEAFCKLNEKQKQKLFAACVSKSLQPQLSTEQTASPVFEAIAKRMNVDVAKDWRPTGDNFLNRVTKSEVLTTGKETIGEDWVHEHQKKPKGDVVSVLNAAFNKPGKKQFNEEQLEALSSWLPEGMK